MYLLSNIAHSLEDNSSIRLRRIKLLQNQNTLVDDDLSFLKTFENEQIKYKSINDSSNYFPTSRSRSLLPEIYR